MISSLAERAAANETFFAAAADRIARLCASMADRFAAGGRLIAIGVSPSARSDVRHVAVEFVHPVIVGKRALPAIGLSGDTPDVAAQLALFGSPSDIVIAFGTREGPDGQRLVAAMAAARRAGCLTIAFDELGAETEFYSPIEHAFAWQEIVETTYHVLWELVHVFFEHGGEANALTHPGQSAFLYPFLTPARRDRDAVIADVSRSVLVKARDVSELRARTFDTRVAADLDRAAAELRERIDSGGAVLAFGNGGSATDATDFVADFRAPPCALGLCPRRALDLTEDSSILTALANDVGADLIFARQVDAYARGGDVAVAFSTSGTSRNIIAALEAARRRGVLTIAFTGHDGGRIAGDKLADYVINVPSEYVPRIQETHATGYHHLRETAG